MIFEVRRSFPCVFSVVFALCHGGKVFCHSSEFAIFFVCCVLLFLQSRCLLLVPASVFSESCSKVTVIASWALRSSTYFLSSRVSNFPFSLIVILAWLGFALCRVLVCAHSWGSGSVRLTAESWGLRWTMDIGDLEGKGTEFRVTGQSGEESSRPHSK